MFSYYKDFKLKNIFTPKFNHLFLVLFWPVYLTGFMLTEKFVVPTYDVYCPLDDLIPFCELFVIPYVLWYAILAFVSLYTLFCDVPAFKSLYKFLFVSCFFTFAIYIIFPNMQNLRPTEFARDNLLIDIMKGLYAADTNTNVCPSLHVVFSMGMLFAVWNTKHFDSTAWRIANTAIAVTICLSTVFLKQHSVIDIFAGVVLSFAIFPFIFLKKVKKNKNIEKEEFFC